MMKLKRKRGPSTAGWQKGNIATNKAKQLKHRIRRAKVLSLVAGEIKLDWYKEMLDAGKKVNKPNVPSRKNWRKFLSQVE